MKKLQLNSLSISNIRNFAVIAHIDHGKTSLSNCLLELTGQNTKEIFEIFSSITNISSNSFSDKGPLDSLKVEQDRGITVKAHHATMFYTYKEEVYMLNLIDTPGHADFSYEVQRSLSACDGCLLIVDASQGVQAQTMANFFLAFNENLSIIPVLNKIDLPHANVQHCIQQFKEIFGIESQEILLTSAKNKIGIEEILPTIIEKIPPPKSSSNKPLRILLFDSWFDKFRGIVCLVKIVDGNLKKGDRIISFHTKQEYDVIDIGILYPNPIITNYLYTGQVGWILLGMKKVSEALIGDTFHHINEHVEPLPGFKNIKSMVFSGIYPLNNQDLEKLEDAIEKLTMNDAGVTVKKESSDALGLGFRCGFLGLLHMDIFSQRLKEEYGLDIIITSPTVPYKIKFKGKKMDNYFFDENGFTEITNPSQYPDNLEIEKCLEPWITATIIIPQNCIGNVLSLCQERRGEQQEFNVFDQTRIILKYKFPLNEIISNFYNKLKEISSGYATFDYEEAGYFPTNLTKLNILINGKIIDSLSLLVHKSKSEQFGHQITAKLKNVIDRQLFPVVIQATIGNKIIARETVPALRKNVTAKCYGGDVTRKRKLLEKQKEGKKKMKQIGNVELSAEAFLAILTKDENDKN